jgi:hypothetical protein
MLATRHSTLLATPQGRPLHIRPRGLVRVRVTPFPSEVSTSEPGSKVPLALAGSVLPFLLQAQAAFAEEGAHDVLKGTSVALLHPIIMGGLLAGTLYAG